jgi:hypothetical protein
VTDSVLEYNNAITQYRLARETTLIQQRILERVTENLTFGTDNDMFNLMNAFSNYIQAAVAEINLTASYRIARANVDRLTLSGFYSELALHYPSESDAMKDPFLTETK